MGQITLYLDKKSEEAFRRRAKMSRLSLSKWVAGALKERTLGGWPNDVKQLAGAWPDLGDAGQSRKRLSQDIRRENL